MRRPLLSLLLLLVLPVLARAQSVKLPGEVKAVPGMILVKAETESAHVEWWAPDGGLQVIPSELLKSTATAVCFSVTPGRYRLVAIVAKGDKPAYATTTVIVGDAPPPGPGPGPGPKPPTPEPTDEPYLSLKVAWLKEADQKKDEYRKWMASVWSEARHIVAKHKTAGELLDKAREAIATRLPGKEMDGLRRAVATWLSTQLPTDRNAPLDATTKARCEAAFVRVAAALEQLR